MKRAITAVTLLALGLAGCLARPSLTEPDTAATTPHQALAIESTHVYAERLGVRVDRVRITDYLPLGASAWTVAWADCRTADGPQWISFYAPALERIGESDVRLAAAHEVCHVLHGDTLTCGQGDAEAKEMLASSCAREVVGER